MNIFLGEFSFLSIDMPYYRQIFSGSKISDLQTRLKPPVSYHCTYNDNFGFLKQPFLVFYSNCYISLVYLQQHAFIFSLYGVQDRPELYFYAIPILLVAIFAFLIAHCFLSVYEVRGKVQFPSETPSHKQCSEGMLF